MVARGGHRDPAGSLRRADAAERAGLRRDRRRLPRGRRAHPFLPVPRPGHGPGYGRRTVDPTSGPEGTRRCHVPRGSLQHHVQALGAGDLDEIVADYSDDASSSARQASCAARKASGPRSLSCSPTSRTRPGIEDPDLRRRRPVPGVGRGRRRDPGRGRHRHVRVPRWPHPGADDPLHAAAQELIPGPAGAARPEAAHALGAVRRQDVSGAGRGRLPAAGCRGSRPSARGENPPHGIGRDRVLDVPDRPVTVGAISSELSTASSLASTTASKKGPRSAPVMTGRRAARGLPGPPAFRWRRPGNLSAAMVGDRARPGQAQADAAGQPLAGRVIERGVGQHDADAGSLAGLRTLAGRAEAGAARPGSRATVSRSALPKFVSSSTPTT